MPQVFTNGEGGRGADGTINMKVGEQPPLTAFPSPGGLWKGDIMVADIEEFGADGRIRHPW